jgi:eukaryotic-like serine/threonine-protein kinase
MRPVENGVSVSPSGAASDQSRAANESRLLRAAQEYREALDSGQKPNRQDFLARHSDIALELAECLDGLELIHAAAPELRDANTSPPAFFGEEGLPSVPLGDYRIIKEIGRGGMGIVYEAIQLSLGRRIALKVLPFAAALDPKHLQRFRNEAQAAAHFYHPNIVPVYAVGCERGVHFYAMQLIEGQTLAVVIHQWRELAGQSVHSAVTQPYTPARSASEGKPPDDPSLALRASIPNQSRPTPTPRASEGKPSDEPSLALRAGIQNPPPSLSKAAGVSSDDGSAASSPATAVDALSTERAKRSSAFFRTIAQLGQQAAEALEHAHQMGIVHRDIKPANLLVDARGNIWLTDFGLAQFHADAGLTFTGDLVGTLRYMSPEQALGGRAVIDHRTDVYSLGITLYEILTLHPPFTGADRQDLLQQIASEDPRLPRAMDRAIPVELETIILKAIAKSPSDRYATAQDMADDLRWFLEYKPIRARRPSLADKSRKWARRHRHLVASAVAVLAVATAGLLVGIVLIAREQAKTETAYRLERRRAAELLAKQAQSDENFRLARQAVDSLAVLGASGSYSPQATELRKEVLQRALNYYQTFIEQRQGDPSSAVDLQAARARVENILGDLSTVDAYNRHAFRHMLIRERSVEKELGITADQAAKSFELGHQMMTRRDELASKSVNLDPADRQRRFDELTRATDNGLAAFLSAKQLRRLGQIALQVRGVRAFADAEVADSLRLTTEQKNAIRAVLDRLPRAALPRFAHDRDAEREQESDQQTSDRLVQEIVGRLTPAQRAKWQEMIGPPFKGELFFPRRGPPGPAGPDGPMERGPGPHRGHEPRPARIENFHLSSN